MPRKTVPQAARVLQFALPFPPFTPEPCDDGGPDDPRPRRRRAEAPAVDVDQQADRRQASLWQEAA